MTETSPYLTVAETAEVLGISSSGVYKLIQRGRLRAIRRTAHGTRISRLALDAYRRRLEGNVPPFAAVAAAPVELEQLLTDFMRQTGVAPSEWERRWKADEIEDTAENMRHTVKALALRAAEKEQEGTSTRNVDPLLVAAFTQI